jgi:hypothetical protein
LGVLLLSLTTIRRLALVLLVFLVWTPAAYAWSWPVHGPVLQPFSYDEAHPYASGQHRGIDIGADAAGETVLAPAAGTISFAGTVPTNGKTITIETADGYSVTLTHLGSIAVAKGATVAEQDAVGTIGPSGTPEVDAPYVHLGIRLTADPNGYVDPLGLLPPVSGDAAQTSTTAAQPASSGAASAAPAAKPAPSAPRSTRVAATHRARTKPAQSHVRTHPEQRAQEPRSTVRSSRSQHSSAAQDRTNKPTSISRPVPRRTVLDDGLEAEPTLSITQPQRKPSSPLLALACNWAAALFAFGAALAVHRRRPQSAVSAPVLHLPPPVFEERRAA